MAALSKHAALAHEDEHCYTPAPAPGAPARLTLTRGGCLIGTQRKYLAGLSETFLVSAPHLGIAKYPAKADISAGVAGSLAQPGSVTGN